MLPQQIREIHPFSPQRPARVLLLGPVSPPFPNWPIGAGLNENTLTYKKQFGDHNLSVLAGGTVQETAIESFTTSNTQFVIEDLGFNGIGLGTSPIIPSSNLERSGIVSALARVNYGYKDKYLVTLSYRADGSSRFAEGQKWGYFPAAALAWKVNNEKFLEASKTISNLKLRAG